MKTQGSLVACGDRLALDKPSIIVIEAEVSRPTVKTPSSWVPTQELEVFFSRSRLSLVYVSVGMSEAINRAKARCCLPGGEIPKMGWMAGKKRKSRRGNCMSADVKTAPVSLACLLLLLAQPKATRVEMMGHV